MMIGMPRKKVLVLCLSALDKDPRVSRQIRFLEEAYDVTAAGFTNPTIGKVSFIPIDRPKRNVVEKVRAVVNLKLGRYERFYWNNQSIQKAFHTLQDLSFDVIIANDLNTLPLALALAKRVKAKVLLDAHEYAPREFEDKFLFRFFFQDYWEAICKKYLPKTDAMTTVCLGIAEEYSKQFGISCEVITNAPFYQKLEPKKTREHRIRMIHHGACIPSRKLENMMHLMHLLDSRFELDFMLTKGHRRYYERLVSMASKTPRCRFLDSVILDRVVETINDYDIGLYFLEPNGFNNRMALPNKFFEFIQARLAVAIWPSPEMAKVVRRFDCGYISEDFSVESMASLLNGVSESAVFEAKKKSHVASESLCAERDKEILLSIIDRMVNNT